jgi:hypothetical protein
MLKAGYAQVISASRAHGAVLTPLSELKVAKRNGGDGVE